MEEKNWLEPNEVLDYDEDKGQECINDPKYNWCNEDTDEIGDDDVKTEG